MSNYRKSIGKTFEFEGDKVRVIVTPMKRKDALKIIPLLNIDTETGKAQLTLENQYQILDVAADLLPKSIKEFQGLKDNEGRSYERFEFYGLTSDVVFDLFNHSHNIGQGIDRIDWPDGMPYLEQDNMLVMIFDTIKSEIILMRAQHG